MKSIAEVARSPLFSGGVAVAVLAIGTIGWKLLFPAPPGTEFRFEVGFQGNYCLLLSSEYPELKPNAEGFLVVAVPTSGIVRTSTSLPGKSAASRAFYVDANGMVIGRAPESACGSWWFGDKAILMGVVGDAQCVRIDASRVLGFGEAVASVCNAR